MYCIIYNTLYVMVWISARQLNNKLRFVLCDLIPVSVSCFWQGPQTVSVNKYVTLRTGPQH